LDAVRPRGTIVAVVASAFLYVNDTTVQKGRGLEQTKGENNENRELGKSEPHGIVEIIGMAGNIDIVCDLLL
tara:strand:+ start:917 stop:1132 length:216 start_codon:yes stop_codon:yes gene_type:complete